MAYDSAISSFTTKTDKVDLVSAAHINAVQNELVAIETILGTNVKGDRADLKTRLNNALDADGSLLSGSSFPSPALASQTFYRTDLDSFYIRNAANTLWQQFGNSLSNVLFQYSGNTDGAGTNLGEVTNASLTALDPVGAYRYLLMSGSSYVTVWTSKFIKIPGVSTVTVYCRIWVRASTTTANLKCDIGGANNNVSGTANQTTPEWKSFTIDVSGLSNGTVYDVTVQLRDSSGNTNSVRCGHIIAFGS